MALDVGERAPLAAATLQRLGFPPNRAMYRAGVHAEGTCFYHSLAYACLLYTSPSPRDGLLSRMPSSA